MRSFDYRLRGLSVDGEVVSLVSLIHEYKGQDGCFVSLAHFSSVARPCGDCEGAECGVVEPDWRGL